MTDGIAPSAASDLYSISILVMPLVENPHTGGSR
jgi:hypothetical protein